MQAHKYQCPQATVSRIKQLASEWSISQWVIQVLSCCQ